MLNPILVNLSVLLSQPTGITNYALNLLPYLQPLEPTLLTAQTFKPFNCYPVPANLTPAQGSKGHLRRLLWTQFTLPAIYHELNASVLFSPIPEAPLHVNCRFVVMVHDLIPLRFPKPYSPLTPYFRHYIPQVLAQAQHIVCNSAATAKDIAAFYSIAAAKISPIPLAYDPVRFRPLSSSAQKSESWARNSEGTCSGVPPERNVPFPRIEGRAGVFSGSRFEQAQRQPPYFLYVGRHDPYKNLHRLIDAFAAMAKCQDYQLWLVGPPDRRYTPLLEAQAHERGLSNQVKFLNYVPDRQLPQIINEAIALVFPSLWEGFGLPVLEAMACGTPVITSNLSSLPEVTGEAALLIDPYSIPDITAAMEAIAQNNGLRSRLSQLSLQRASQFSWAKTGQATAEILRRF